MACARDVLFRVNSHGGDNIIFQRHTHTYYKYYRVLQLCVYLYIGRAIVRVRVKGSVGESGRGFMGL